MAETERFAPGGYRYVRGPFQYSGGVAADPGHSVRRVRLRSPVPLEEGFRIVEEHLGAAGRPTTAFCACELRSPAPFSVDGFVAFNRLYVGTLERWGLVRGDENPVARSNVCPEIRPPAVPSLHAFCFTVPEEGAGPPSFVLSGAADASEGRGGHAVTIVRRGETSPEAMREKARFVLGEMEERLDALGVGWRDATATQAYTIRDLHPFLAEEIVGRGAAADGLTWHYARPPVEGLEYEMDVRGVPRELAA